MNPGLGIQQWIKSSYLYRACILVVSWLDFQKFLVFLCYTRENLLLGILEQDLLSRMHVFYIFYDSLWLCFHNPSKTPGPFIFKPSFNLTARIFFFLCLLTNELPCPSIPGHGFFSGKPLHLKYLIAVHL